MPISVPPYMPIAQRQQPNIDIAGSIGGLGDALIGGLEYGQKRKIDRATREAFAGGIPMGPGGVPDYNTMAARMLQLGNMDAGLALTRLAEVQSQNAWERSRPDWQMVGTDLYNLNALPLGGSGGAGTVPGAGGGQAPAAPVDPLGGLGEQPQYPPDMPQPQQQAQAGQPEPVIRGTPKRRTGVVGNKLVDLDTGQIIEEYAPAPKAAKPLGTFEMKTIKEAEDAANAGDTTIKMLDEAITLSDKALSGPAAQQRGYAGSVLPDWAAPGSRESAVATEDLNNLVTRQALESLKAVFGAMPTEGERKILLDIQGSVNQSNDVRKKIYQRAKELAQKRVQENRETAAAVRNREYFSGNEEPVPGATENAGPAEVSPNNPTSPEPPAEGGQIVEMSDGRYWISDDGVTVMKLD